MRAYISMDVYNLFLNVYSVTVFFFLLSHGFLEKLYKWSTLSGASHAVLFQQHCMLTHDASDIRLTIDKITAV